MFGIGFPELLVILALALIVLGPEQLPQVAKKIARFVNELRRAADEFKSEFDVDEVTDLKLLDKIDLNELDQAKRSPGGLGGEWKEAQGPSRADDSSKNVDAPEEEAGQKIEGKTEGEQPDPSNNRVP